MPGACRAVQLWRMRHSAAAVNKAAGVRCTASQLGLQPETCTVPTLLVLQKRRPSRLVVSFLQMGLHAQGLDLGCMDHSPGVVQHLQAQLVRDIDRLLD